MRPNLWVLVGVLSACGLNLQGSAGEGPDGGVAVDGSVGADGAARDVAVGQDGTLGGDGPPAKVCTPLLDGAIGVGPKWVLRNAVLGRRGLVDAVQLTNDVISTKGAVYGAAPVGLDPLSTRIEVRAALALTANDVANAGEGWAIAWLNTADGMPPNLGGGGVNLGVCGVQGATGYALLVQLDPHPTTVSLKYKLVPVPSCDGSLLNGTLSNVDPSDVIPIELNVEAASVSLRIASVTLRTPVSNALTGPTFFGITAASGDSKTAALWADSLLLRACP